MRDHIESNESIRYQLAIETETSSYPIMIGEGLFDACLDTLEKYPSILLLTNDTLLDLYHEGVIGLLQKSLPFLSCMSIPDGERYKNIDTLREIYERLLSRGVARDGCVVAFGGGVVGDVAGFAAATFMRGIDYVQIPTTLLAMVDSSIGGKTGINLPKGKNMIGSFHHPRAVFCDLDFLDTLPKREYHAGMMEVIKYGLILDDAFYGFISANREQIASRDREAVAYLIYRSCQLKAQIVVQDEKEKGIRAILNFGHTIGHAIESHTNYATYLHGEAVALGALALIRHLVDKNMLDCHVLEGFIGMLQFFELPTFLPPAVDVDAVMSHIAYDKKRGSGIPKWVTLNRIGFVTWGQSVELEEIREVLRGLQKNG
jgi:3-dehydroquinate synthase